MAVFTPLTQTELDTWLNHYSLGIANQLKDISSGIENSNFFLSTTQGEFVLTIFEKLDVKILPYYLNLMRHLAKANIPAPEPIQQNDGALFSLLKEKPAAIVTKLKGEPIQEPTEQHCALIGKTLARLHLAGQNFPEQQPNLRSLIWWQNTVPTLKTHVSAQQWQLLTDELAFQEDFFNSIQYAALPSGVCHCDLFKDNVLFAKNEHDLPLLSGILDFYFAGHDKWLFDLAVTVNDWCIKTDAQLDEKRYHTLIQHYQDERPFTQDERLAWPTMLRTAAYRFWVSRLYDFHYPRHAALLKPHDPSHFEQILTTRIHTSVSL